MCVRACVGEGNEDEKTHLPVGRAPLIYTRYLITAVHCLGNFFIHFLSSRIISLMYAKQRPRDAGEMNGGTVGEGGGGGDKRGVEELYEERRISFEKPTCAGICICICICTRVDSAREPGRGGCNFRVRFLMAKSC